MSDNTPLTEGQAAEISARLMKDHDESLSTARLHRDRVIERAKGDYIDTVHEIEFHYQSELFKYGLSEPVNLKKRQDQP